MKPSTKYSPEVRERVLDYGGVRRTRWMGRKIAFDRVLG